MSTILVIEDEKYLRENIVDMLSVENYRVLSASDGKSALRTIQEVPPDVILCDVMMPEMDGYGVLEALRSDHSTSTIPFIFLTAMADRTFMRKGMELGASDYLTKPFSPDELLGAVRIQLQKRVSLEQGLQKEKDCIRKTVMRMVTHEFRSPLAGMNLAQQLIERQLDHLSKEDIRELLQTLQTGSRRLQNVVNQMLLATQLEAHMLDIQEEGDYAEPSQLLMVAVDQARTLAYRNRSADIQFDYYGNSIFVFGIGKVLVQAFAEVIANAINFSPANKEIRVTLWTADDQVWISVVDYGPGIPAHKLEQALKPFEQVNRETQEQQGLGLGLAIARQIIELHNGQIEINSTVGKGTEVLIGLPCYQAEHEDYMTENSDDLRSSVD